MNKISFFNKHKKTNLVSGFTLIELLVVVSIIALLSSVIMSAFGTANQRSKDTAKINALQEVRSALQLYVTDKKYYPSDIKDLVAGKYIASIDQNIKYNSLFLNNTFCPTAPCPSYHLAVSLDGRNNKVLNTDKDINDGNINGKSDTCAGSADNSTLPDLCYDVTP